MSTKRFQQRCAHRGFDTQRWVWNLKWRLPPGSKTRLLQPATTLHPTPQTPNLYLAPDQAHLDATQPYLTPDPQTSNRRIRSGRGRQLLPTPRWAL